MRNRPYRVQVAVLAVLSFLVAIGSAWLACYLSSQYTPACIVQAIAFGIVAFTSTLYACNFPWLQH